MEELASLAEFVGRYKSEVEFPLRYVAVPAPLYAVRVVVREGLLLHAGVELEHAPRVLGRGSLAALHGFVVGCLCVFRLAHLHRRTSAVPAADQLLPTDLADFVTGLDSEQKKIAFRKQK